MGSVARRIPPPSVPLWGDVNGRFSSTPGGNRKLSGPATNGSASMPRAALTCRTRPVSNLPSSTTGWLRFSWSCRTRRPISLVLRAQVVGGVQRMAAFIVTTLRACGQRSTGRTSPTSRGRTPAWQRSRAHGSRHTHSEGELVPEQVGCRDNRYRSTRSGTGTNVTRAAVETRRTPTPAPAASKGGQATESLSRSTLL